MRVLISIALFLCLTQAVHSASKATMDRIRDFWSISPIESHPRGKTVLMNVNVNLPVDDSSKKPPGTEPPVAKPDTTPKQRGRGVVILSKAELAHARSRPDRKVTGPVQKPKSEVHRQQSVPLVPPAGSVKGSQSLLPLPSRRTRPSQRVPSSKLTTTVRPITMPARQNPPRRRLNVPMRRLNVPRRRPNLPRQKPNIPRPTTKCSFNIDLNATLDMTLSKGEFARRYLIPALAAYVVGGDACRTEEMTNYIDKTFNLMRKLQ